MVSKVQLQSAFDEVCGGRFPDLSVGAIEDRKTLTRLCMNKGWLSDCFQSATGQQFYLSMIPSSGKGSTFFCMVGLFAKTGVVEHEMAVKELVAFLFVEQSFVPGCFYLSNLVVSAAWKRRGVGTSLLGVTEAFLGRVQTASCFQLNVNNEDHATWLQRFYERNGYRERRTGESLFFGADPAVEFALVKLV